MNKTVKNKTKETKLDTYNESELNWYREGVLKGDIALDGMTHTALGQCHCVLLMGKGENSLRRRHKKSKSVHDGIEIYFDFQKVNKK